MRMHNFLPTPGEPYTNGQLAYRLMLASADSAGVFIEVEYLDEGGVVQKRRLGKGVWPIVTTQINGYRVISDLTGSIYAEVSGDNFEISVIM